MAAKNTAVFGIYPSRLEMDEAVDRLRRAGFRNADISALLQDNQGTKDFAHEKNTKAPEGFTAGAIVGVIIGGVFGWLIGAGQLTVPQLVGFTAAGPVVAALAGAGALGILCAIIGALVGMGSPEYEARRYLGRIRDGGVLMSVHCDSHDWVKRAKDVMAHAGGQRLGVQSEKSGDFGNVDVPVQRARATNIPLREEDYAERRPEYVERRPDYVERNPEYVERKQEYVERKPEYVEHTTTTRIDRERDIDR